MERAITVSQKDVDALAKTMASAQIELLTVNQQNDQEKTQITDRQKELMLLLQQAAALKEALASLLEQKKALPTEDQVPLSIPNIDRRQYLTGVKLEGELVLFLVRVSGSMLDDTIDGVVTRLQGPEFKKREAPKWQRTLHALEWMIATLGPETHFQILLFADDTLPILPDRPEDWFSPTDRQSVNEIVRKLHSIVPQGAANLERAFASVRAMRKLPDSIVLLTDGLPTKSDSFLTEGAVDDDTRTRLFNVARRQLPPRIPVSTILFPLNGDPAAAALFWELANATRGAFVCPAKSWPDT
jgi:Mg-chelatase subunit ChlD